MSSNVDTIEKNGRTYNVGMNEFRSYPLHELSKEDLTEEKLCFCDSRPDESIDKVIDYLWKDESKDYYSGEWGCPDENHIYHDICQIVEWMYFSTEKKR